MINIFVMCHTTMLDIYLAGRSHLYSFHRQYYSVIRSYLDIIRKGNRPQSSCSSRAHDGSILNIPNSHKKSPGQEGGMGALFIVKFSHELHEISKILEKKIRTMRERGFFCHVDADAPSMVVIKSKIVNKNILKCFFYQQWFVDTIYNDDNYITLVTVLVLSSIFTYYAFVLCIFTCIHRNKQVEYL